MALKNIDENKKLLFKNTIFLYILTFSSYFFTFITVPYQTRILGVVLYGKIGVATAIMAYFHLFLDFGFLLSATADISKNRQNKNYISKRFTSITIIKITFSLFSLVLMFILCCFVNKFRENTLLYMLFLVATIINSLLPDYVYRGIEQMKAITVRTVLIKFFFTIMIFIFLKSKNDYLLIPILQIIGNLGAVIGVYVHLYKKVGVWFVRVSFKEVIEDFKKSLTFFLSRIATTVYSSANTIILGFIDTTGIVTGYYTSADKIISTAKNGMSPISDSMYPYMIKNKDFKLIKKVLCIFMPIIITGCVIVYIFAKPLCIWFFGSEYSGVAPVLRALLPVVIVILPSYILGFPTLGAMDLSKYANYSIYFGTTVQIIGIIILACTGKIGVISLAIMTSISETSIMIFRLIIVFKNKNIFSKGFDMK